MLVGVPPTEKIHGWPGVENNGGHQWRDNISRKSGVVETEMFSRKRHLRLALGKGERFPAELVRD